MEENKLSERESLELISRMISSTREGLKVGAGNTFLCFGYFTAALSILLFILVFFTQNNIWAYGWFLMFVFWGIMEVKRRKELKQESVVTYTDTVLAKVWWIIAWLFLITVLMMGVVSAAHGYGDFSLMLPLSLLYGGIGTSITGIIIKEPSVMYTPLVGFAFAIYMLMQYTFHEPATVDWYLYFGLSFIIMMVIPGHILNKKAKHSC